MKETLDNRICRVYGKIEKRIKVCFFSALICGLMAHIYALTNHLYNYDELWHTPTGFGTGVQVGRWALSATVWIQKVLFDDCFTIPFINGTLTIVLYAIAACFVVLVFNIKDSFYAGSVGALMTTFPALTSRMFFMFTTHYYAIGIALVAVGTWIFARKKHSVINVILSIMLTVYGMAIYQANFVTSVCILVGYLLVEFISENPDLKSSVRSCCNCVIYLAGCMIMFFVGSKVALAITGYEMETYENLDTMGQLSLGQTTEGIIRCYKTFFKLPLKDVYSMNPNGIVKLAFLVCFVIFFFTLSNVWMTKKELHLKVLITLIFMAIPIAVNLIVIMAIASGTMYSIMVYEIVFVFVLAIACIEPLCIMSAEIQISTFTIYKARKTIEYGYAGIIVLTVLTYIWFANGNYLALEYQNNHDNAYYQVLMTQIKSVEGYNAEMPIAMIGKPVADSSYTRQDMIGETFDIGGKNHSNIASYSSWNIMTRVLGYDPEVRNSDEDEVYFRELEEVKNMPCYPNSGSIRIIDDTIVIKFQEVEDLKK